MANDGFNFTELTKFEKKLLNLASTTMPKESKKFLKKSATKLSKVQKKSIKSLGVGIQGVTEKEIAVRSKGGKVYKHSGGLSCRAYNGHPLAHLINEGFILKGGQNHDGAETFVAGYKFIEKSQQQFQGAYDGDIQDFIDDVLERGL